MAFGDIVFYSVSFPAKILPAFEKCFLRRNELIDVSTHSWKRPGVEYGVMWLYFYKVASRCLSEQASPIIEASPQFKAIHQDRLSFTEFEDVLLNCR